MQQMVVSIITKHMSVGEASGEATWHAAVPKIDR